MEYKRAQDSQIVLTELMLPSYSNFGGKIHGGYILNLMDQVAFACASKHCGRYCVTASVNKVDFLNPVEVGELLSLKASINYTGKTSMVIGLRVESENIKTGETKHCNSSYFTMVAKPENGVKTQIPGLILESEDAIRRFVRSIVRRRELKGRNEAFLPENFNSSDFLDLLKSQNAKIQLD